MPEITVLLAVRNGARYLRAAVESVLAQSFADFELLLIDDASTDDTPRLIESWSDPRIRRVRHPSPIGLTKSLNSGLHLASGALIARHDADDISHPERLRLQRDVLQRDPANVLVGSRAGLIDSAGRRFGRKWQPQSDGAIRWAHLFENAFVHSAVMFRKTTVLDELGGYDESFETCQDYDLWSRALRIGKAGNLPEPLLDLRLHEQSVSATRRAAADEATRRVVRANLTATFPERDFDADEIELITQFRNRIPPTRVQEFLSLYDELWEKFPSQYKAEPEISHTRAMLRMLVGYRLLPEHPRAAWSEFMCAATGDARVLMCIPWIRSMGLTLLGRNAQRFATLVARLQPVPQR
jgi:glycosyltransferase involved in cell wall biosynthesis